MKIKKYITNSNWPDSDLERVVFCPICNKPDRKLLHRNLIDNTFGVAPGTWSLWRCSHCGCAYMDPCPTPKTIHLAYSSYYTHQRGSEKDDYESLSLFRKFRRILVNGYSNWRYSTKAEPFSYLGVVVALLIPNLRRVLDRQYRNIPKVPKEGGLLLDIGCGNGSFLTLARSCGWNVIGLDPDPKAVEYAKSQDLDVKQGGIEYFREMSNRFDVITMNHVIEHLHEPAKVIEECYALLKPGGQLWIETPNIDSFGHEYFGKNWRGLESPRHLVIFNYKSLNQILKNAGFNTSENVSSPSQCVGMYQASFAMKLGQYPYADIKLPRKILLLAKLASIAEFFWPSRREFLTMIARKEKS